VKKQITELGVKKVIESRGNYFFLRGREKIVGLRKKREKWAREKWVIAQKTAAKLERIPGIRLIGVTGALAMNNCKREDDIDLLVITSAGCLWLVRLLIVMLSPLMKIARRKPGETKVTNKICFNLFLEENHLEISPHNLFLAHEVCQMKPLLNKDRVHEKFLWGNQWVKDYLPNALNNEAMKQYSNSQPVKAIVSLFDCFIAVLNKVAFALQHQYMKPKMTSEKVSLHQAFFHPLDLEPKIRRQYEEKLKDLTILQ